MSKERPTQSQILILELLSAFEYLTTMEVCDYLGHRATKRAVEQRLRLLQKHGFVRADLLSPVRGAASERRWWPRKKGYDAIGFTGVPGASGASEGTRATTEPTEPSPSPSVCCGRGATAREAAVLRLLVEMRHLTTSQIRRHLHPEKPKWYTWRLLSVLQELGYIRGERMYPELGAASECYWTVCRAGAEAVGSKYDRRYLRWPARRTIEHRGLLLEMERQVHVAGWSLIKSVAHIGGRQEFGGAYAEPYKRYSGKSEEQRIPMPGDTPQRLPLVEAVLHSEAAEIERLAAQGYTHGDLQDRIERLKARQVGAVVPRAPSDDVAYVPGEPEWTAVLIPHPSWAGRAFWVRRPGHRQKDTGRQASSRARLEKYARLAKVLPVIAVFSTEEAGHPYAELFARAGFHWTTVEQLGQKLSGFSGPPYRSSNEKEPGEPGNRQGQAPGSVTAVRTASSST